MFITFKQLSYYLNQQYEQQNGDGLSKISSHIYQIGFSF